MAFEGLPEGENLTKRSATSANLARKVFQMSSFGKLDKKMKLRDSLVLCEDMRGEETQIQKPTSN